jgi:uncharacterized protein YjiS (DUF1127 family)
MSWINRLSFHVMRFLALRLRNMVQRRTASALAQLDDRALAVIGVPRYAIADYARELAHRSIPLPPELAAKARTSVPDTRGEGQAPLDAARV